MNFPIQLYASGRPRTVILGDLSRTGMFVRVPEPIPVGTIVHAVIPPTVGGGERALTAGTIVHSLDARAATSAGRPPGVGIRFREPINARDARFAEVVGELLARHIRVVPAPAHRIVIGDHHPRVVEQLSDLLARAGFAVGVATTGLELLSACHRLAPDVVLADGALPLVDGFALLRRLRGTPVIVSSYDHGDFARAFELGAADFLPKPFTARELVARARRLVHAKDRVVLRGSLGDLAVPELLTMLDQTRKSGRLTLVCDGELATVDLAGGRIVDAHCDDLALRAVLARVLDWRAGTFELAARAIVPAAGALSITHLLLEHACRTDELRRTG